MNGKQTNDQTSAQKPPDQCLWVGTVKMLREHIKHIKHIKQSRILEQAVKRHTSKMCELLLSEVERQLANEIDILFLSDTERKSIHTMVRKLDAVACGCTSDTPNFSAVEYLLLNKFLTLPKRGDNNVHNI